MIYNLVIYNLARCAVFLGSPGCCAALAKAYSSFAQMRSKHDAVANA
jgi:hypothetical protein